MLLINSQPSGGVASNNSDWCHSHHTTPYPAAHHSSTLHPGPCFALPVSVSHYSPTKCASDSISGPHCIKKPQCSPRKHSEAAMQKVSQTLLKTDRELCQTVNCLWTIFLSDELYHLLLTPKNLATFLRKLNSSQKYPITSFQLYMPHSVRVYIVFNISNLHTTEVNCTAWLTYPSYNWSK